MLVKTRAEMNKCKIGYSLGVFLCAGIDLNYLHSPIQLTFTITLPSDGCFHPHFTEEKRNHREDT